MKTAVEWLLEELLNGDWYHLPESIKNKIIEQAKEMEKEQICNAWYNSLTKGDYNSANEYYNETFKSETIVTEFKDGTIKVETFKSE